MTGLKLLQHLEHRPTPPHMAELQALYQCFVCDTITDEALVLFKRDEIVRHVAKSIYIQLRKKDTASEVSVQRVMRILKISRATVFRYRDEMRNDT